MKSDCLYKPVYIVVALLYALLELAKIMHYCNKFVYIVAALLYVLLEQSFLYALLEQSFCMHVHTKFVCIMSIPSGAKFLYKFFARIEHVL
jgi:hypothetical protein